MSMEQFYSSEAESRVLGGILIDPSMIDQVSAIVRPEQFYSLDNRIIFATMMREVELGNDPDMVQVGDYLNKIKPEEESWVVKLAILERNTPSAANIKLYAEKVREYSQLRELFQAGSKIHAISADHELTTSQRIAKAQELMMGLFQTSEQNGPKLIKDLAKGYVDHVDACYRSQNGITGLSTGFATIDNRTGELQPGELFTLAARPGMGKTNLALNISRHVAFDQGKYVLYFSAEMTSDELLGRLAADVGKLDYNLVRTAQFEDEHWPRFSTTVSAFANAKLIIDESTDISISTLCARARQEHRKYGLSLIVVDHIGLIEADGETETAKISKISRSLKNLAKQLSIPVIELSQLNRGCESRTNKRPLLSDLRQSGSIEQDSNSVAFIYRDVQYNENTQFPFVAELIWRKLRAGEIGTDYLSTQFSQCRFVDGCKPDDYDMPAKVQPIKKSRGMSW